MGKRSGWISGKGLGCLVVGVGWEIPRAKSPTSVMPDLIRHPAASFREPGDSLSHVRKKSLTASTRGGWIPAQGRGDGGVGARSTRSPAALPRNRFSAIERRIHSVMGELVEFLITFQSLDT